MEFDGRCIFCLVASKTFLLTVTTLSWVALVTVCAANSHFTYDKDLSAVIAGVFWNAVQRRLCSHSWAGSLLNALRMPYSKTQIRPHATCAMLVVCVAFYLVNLKQITCSLRCCIGRSLPALGDQFSTLMHWSDCTNRSETSTIAFTSGPGVLHFPDWALLAETLMSRLFNREFVLFIANYIACWLSSQLTFYLQTFTIEISVVGPKMYLIGHFNYCIFVLYKFIEPKWILVQY